MRNLGDLRIDYLERYFGSLSTSEVILTDERELHIKTRHPQDYELFMQKGAETLEKPDIVIRDTSNIETVFVVKKIESTNLNVVVKLALSCEGSEYKNSVMTAYRLRDKNLAKLIKKHGYNILYKKEY